uniref:DUF1758 domain-containing protein n=1 Tax=Glossina pallidipes TaxID=7398 RepID=A0A1A9ZRN3_GLOPL
MGSSRVHPIPPSSTTEPPGVNSNASNAVVTSAAADNSIPHKIYVLLATARVRIIAANGNSAILDSGSQVNLVSERLTRKLGASTSETSLRIDGIFNGQKRATRRVNVKLSSRDASFTTDLEASIFPSIIPRQPNHSLDVSEWKIPNINLANPYFNQPGKVDILLGAVYYFKLMQKGKIELSNDLSKFLNTSLG